MNEIVLIASLQSPIADAKKELDSLAVERMA